LDEVIVYCAGGVRSVLAADALQKMGYKKVYSLKGGIKGWKDQGNMVNINMRMYSPLLKDYN
jgi:rhodanese-related sulfurtransferase